MNKFAEIYDRPDMLDAFGSNYLEPPEVMLLNEIAGKQADMLDIGIGSGRTSVFFLPVVRRYVGVDISMGMIGRSRRRIKGLATACRCELRLADAATLAGFSKNSFDVVLFSYNGIDCIPTERRDDCIKAMIRVLKPGGRLVYSSHNIRYLRSYYKFRGPSGPLRRLMRPRTLVNELNRLRVNRAVNGPLEQYLELGQAEFWDDTYHGRPDAKHVHIRPEFEISRLNSMGLADVAALSKDSGRVLMGEELCTNRDPWVFFSCRKPANRAVSEHGSGGMPRGTWIATETRAS
jgi:ubiquinone/menaquinone biosynthesis C-methylase UbiE